MPKIGRKQCATCSSQRQTEETKRKKLNVTKTKDRGSSGRNQESTEVVRESRGGERGRGWM